MKSARLKGLTASAVLTLGSVIAVGCVGPQGLAGQDGRIGDPGDPGARGPEGAQGDPGEKGAPGDKGATGEKGGKGDKGDRGEKGDSGEVVPSADPGPGKLSSGYDQAIQGGVPHANRVIFFLGDGMGIPVVTAARIFAHGEEGELHMDRLPETGFVRTFSRDSRVTDSAPSMSAYMTGVKGNNGVVSMTGETPHQGKGSAVPTLLEWAEAAGWSSGVVTTTRVTHATPAATYAHVSDRDDEDTIARQLVPGGLGWNSTLGNGLEVVFGGGRSKFTGRKDGRDLVEELRAKGYAYASNASELAAIAPSGPSQKVLGLFHGSHMSYELDRPASEPSLAEMSTKAVQILEQNQKGYFLMVEGGRIDHALHDTNAKRALVDTVAFDEAIAAVLTEVKKSDPNLERTLIVVTADHDHTLIHQGYAQRTGRTEAGKAGVLGLVKNYAGAQEGQPSKDADGRPYTILAFGNGPNRISGSRASSPALTDAITSADDYLQESAIRMPKGAETHGGTDVAIHAVGKGSDLFHGFIDNTEVFGLLRKATKL